MVVTGSASGDVGARPANLRVVVTGGPPAKAGGGSSKPKANLSVTVVGGPPAVQGGGSSAKKTENKGFAVYYPGTKTTQAGYYTSDNKFYPELSKGRPILEKGRIVGYRKNDFLPPGYQRAEGISTKEGIGFVPITDATGKKEKDERKSFEQAPAQLSKKPGRTLPFASFADYVGKKAGQIAYRGSPFSFLPGEGAKRVARGTQYAAEKAVRYGQYLVPYYGQALFAGELLEKPILQPQQFKQELKARPVQTALLYGLGALGVKGSIKSVLGRAEARALQKEAKNLKIKFIAEADEKTLNVLAGTKLRGKPIITRTQINIIKQEADKTLGKGASVTLSEARKGKALSLRIAQEGALTKDLAGVPRAVVARGGIRVSKPLEGEPFLTYGRSADKYEILLDTRKGFNVKNGQVVSLGKEITINKIPLNIIKSQTVGVVKHTEVENIFRVYAGDARLRIYKNGGTSYVFNPRINGWLKILPSESFGGQSNILVLKQLKSAIKGSKEAIEKQVGEVIALKKAKNINIQRTVTKTKLTSTTLLEPRTAKATGAYAGLGLYERTEEQVSAIPRPFSKSIPTSITGERLRSKSSGINKNVSSLVNKVENKLKSIPLPISRTKTPERARTGIKSVSALRVNQVQKQGQRPRLRIRSSPKPYEPFRPRLRPSRSSILGKSRSFSLKSSSIFRKARKIIRGKINRRLALRREKIAQSPLKSVTGFDITPRRTAQLRAIEQARYARKVRYASQLQRTGRIRSFKTIAAPRF